MVEPTTSFDPGDQIFESVQTKYLRPVLNDIKHKALAAANNEGHPFTEVDAFRPLEAWFGPKVRASRMPFVRENLLLWIAAGMTLLFGCLGLFPAMFGTSNSHPESFLDIAKLFAGVVVGGAANRGLRHEVVGHLPH